MKLGELIDFCGNLLDYDPTNPTYRAQLVALLNDAQQRVLVDRAWAFAQRERTIKVYADSTADITLTNGSSTATGAFTVSADRVTPGGSLELAEVKIPLAGGGYAYRQLRWIANGTTAYLDRAWDGPTAVYSVTYRRREVYLPSDATNVINVSDPSIGVPRQSLFLSKWERDSANLDRDLEGTVEAYLPSRATRVPAPQTATGVAVTGAGGTVDRTIVVTMVNVWGPRSQNYGTYREDVSNGFESAMSQPTSYELTSGQSLSFTPETLPNETGLYRRYYFTCAEAGILAPVRIRSELTLAGAVAGEDTIAPTGGRTMEPDLALATLQSQAWQSRAVRYQHANGGSYRAIMLYPHPSADQDLSVRVVIAPPRLEEDQDAPLMPEAYSQIIAYAALEQLTLKVDTPALSQVYERKKMLLLRGLEARYLGEVPRRIRKGNPALGMRYYPNPFGPLTLS
jgi:hypothetical protein